MPTTNPSPTKRLATILDGAIEALSETTDPETIARVVVDLKNARALAGEVVDDA